MVLCLKRRLVGAMESACCVVDRLPDWTYPFVGRWVGCPIGLTVWAVRLDDRWDTGVF